MMTLFTPGPAQSGSLVLTGGTVLIGKDLEPHPNVALLIRDGIIIEAGDKRELDFPDNADIIDLDGFVIIPGLIDMHVHMATPELEPGQQMGIMKMPGYIFDIIRFFPGKRRAFLNHGITAIRSAGDDYGWIMELRQMLREGELEGPHLFAAGPLFTTAGGHPIITFGVDPDSDGVRLPSTTDEARNMVRELAGGDDSVDLIKVVQESGMQDFQMEPISREILQAITEEAHAHNLPVFAHWGTQGDLKDLLDTGVNGLEHLEARDIMKGWPPEILEMLVELGVSLSPTFAVLESATLRPENPLSSDILAELQQRAVEFHSAGGRLLAGSDTGMPGVFAGLGLHRELELLTESGLTPRDALKAATSEAAEALRINRIGVIEPGRSADLLVVNGNPLREIREIRNVVMVFKGGRMVVDHRSN